jgi:DNA-directed RNA polymerase subunit E'/Rpb7
MNSSKLLLSFCIIILQLNFAFYQQNYDSGGITKVLPLFPVRLLQRAPAPVSILKFSISSVFRRPSSSMRSSESSTTADSTVSSSSVRSASPLSIKVGNSYDATISTIYSFGIFVNILKDIDVLIPKARLTKELIDHCKKIKETGKIEKLRIRITESSPETGKFYGEIITGEEEKEEEEDEQGEGIKRRKKTAEIIGSIVNATILNILHPNVGLRVYIEEFNITANIPISKLLIKKDLKRAYMKGVQITTLIEGFDSIRNTYNLTAVNKPDGRTLMGIDETHFMQAVVVSMNEHGLFVRPGGHDIVGKLNSVFLCHFVFLTCFLPCLASLPCFLALLLIFLVSGLISVSFLGIVKKEHIPKQLFKYLRNQYQIEGNSLTSFFHIGDVVRLRLFSINLRNYQKAQFTMLPMSKDFINEDVKKNLFADTYADDTNEDVFRSVNMTKEEAIKAYHTRHKLNAFLKYQEKVKLWRRNKKYRLGNWKTEKPKPFNETYNEQEINDEEFFKSLATPKNIEESDKPKVTVDMYGKPILPGEEDKRLANLHRDKERDFFRYTMNERFYGIPSEYLYNPFHCLSWWNGKPFIAPNWKNPYDENVDFVWEEVNNPREGDIEDMGDDYDENEEEEDEEEGEGESEKKEKLNRKWSQKRRTGGRRSVRIEGNEEDDDSYDVEKVENNEDEEDDEEYEEEQDDDEEEKEKEEGEAEEDLDGYTYGLDIEGGNLVYEDYQDPEFEGFFPRANNTEELRIVVDDDESETNWKKHMNKYVRNQTKLAKASGEYDDDDDSYPIPHKDAISQQFDSLPFHPISKEYKTALPVGIELERGPGSDEAFWNRLYLIHDVIEHNKELKNPKIQKEMSMEDTPLERDDFESEEERLFELQQLKVLQHEINAYTLQRHKLRSGNVSTIGSFLDLTTLPSDVLEDVKNSSFYAKHVQPQLDLEDHWEKVEKFRYKKMCKKPIRVFNIKNIQRLIWDDYITFLAAELPKDLAMANAEKKASRGKNRDRNRVLVTDPNEPLWITQEKERRRSSQIADLREQDLQDEREAAGHGTDFSRSSRRRH